MTLLITAITGDGIVMGADSALTFKRGNEQPITLNNYNKIVPVSKLQAGISTAGLAEVQDLKYSGWIIEWLHRFVEESKAESFTPFVEELTAKMNKIEPFQDGQIQDKNKIRVFQSVAWVLDKDENGSIIKIPRFFQISNVEGDYQIYDKTDDIFIKEMLDWKSGRTDRYPIRILTAEFPNNYATWISREGSKIHSNFINSSVPYPNITAVAEYVRFLIKSIAELYRIARQPGIVGEPVETLILFPDSKNMFSTRY